MKKRLVSVLIMVLVLMITGCGKSNSTEENTPMDSFADEVEAQADSTDNRAESNEAAFPKEDSENVSTNEREILAYITDFNVDIISIDVIEWVTIPSSRADELGIKEEDGPSGFYIYNPDTLTEQFTLSAECKITVLDWQNSFVPKTISADDFITVMQERGEQNIFIPYLLEITNGEINQISEHYVP